MDISDISEIFFMNIDISDISHIFFFMDISYISVDFLYEYRYIEN